MKIEEYSKNAAENYLQTAVFVDDEIYERPKRVSVSTAVRITKSRKPASKKVAAKKALGTKTLSPPKEPTGGTLSSYDLLNSFAKKRIVCSLYEPQKGQKYSRRSDAYLLCLSADIVIVDWVIHDERGEHSLELIENLVKQSIEDEPEQLRLILVYTAEVNLLQIADRVYERMPESAIPQKNDGGLAIHTENTRIVVLGKPGLSRSEEYKDYVVEAKDLATKAIAEFTKLANGLLQGTVLQGLAEIKKNARKILTRFSSDLDPAFLTHRALMLPHEEATEHLVPLISSEIEAVLRDCMDSNLKNTALLDDWCDRWTPQRHAKAFMKNGESPNDFAKTFVSRGPEVHTSFPKTVPKKRINDKDGEKVWNVRGDYLRKLSRFLESTDSDRGPQALSELMSYRTQYSGDRVLRFGTIVRSLSNSEYFLCIQPICDSVRLSEVTAFPFLKLQAIENPDQAVSFSLTDSKKTVSLQASYKPSNLWIRSFAPTSGLVKANLDTEGGAEFHFEDSEGENYKWLSELRFAQAQREVSRLASEMSRVGLTESEWQRLCAKR